VGKTRQWQDRAKAAASEWEGVKNTYVNHEDVAVSTAAAAAFAVEEVAKGCDTESKHFGDQMDELAGRTVGDGTQGGGGPQQQTGARQRIVG
jgi:hypothetical protein